MTDVHLTPDAVCECSHRVTWHHDTRGCEYHGTGPNRCLCALSSDASVERLITTRLARQREAIATAIEQHRPGFAWACGCGQVKGEENWVAHVTSIAREYGDSG